MSMRECKFCYINGTKIQNRVDVNPYYSYDIRSITNPAELKDIAYIDIEEKFICPKCGQTIINIYNLTLDQEDMKYLINKYIEGRDR